MSEMIDEAVSGQPTLKIHYDTAIPLDAATLGRLLIELNRCFQRNNGKKGAQDVRLTVVDAGLDSHWIELAAVSTGSVIAAGIRYRKEIYEFAEFLGKLVEVSKGLREGKVKVADRRAVDAFVEPLTQGPASQVFVTVLGGTPIINIDRKTAETLWQNDAEEADVPLKLLEAATAASTIGDKAGRPLELIGHAGTILRVKGNWYVRLVHEGGVLNPVILGAGVDVQDDHTYEFDGFWEGKRYVIRKAERIGARHG